MTATAVRSYRLMHMFATTTTGSDVSVWEQWSTVSHSPEGKTETFAEATRIAVSVDRDDAPAGAELDEDAADDELIGGGFSRFSPWVQQDDGQYRAEVDYYDPTP